LEKLESYSEKQPIDYAKQPVEILQPKELPKEWRISRDLSVENIIGQIQKGVSTCSTVSNYCEHMTFDENQIKEAFINEGRGHSPSHLKFFLLVFSKLKEDIKSREDQA